MAKNQTIPDPDASAEPEENAPQIETVVETQEAPNVLILEDYGGRRTGEVRIVPGVYAVNDPKIFGLADYLIGLGKARKV